MQISARFLITASILLTLCGGCAYQSTVALPPVGYPESVFTHPVHNDLAGARTLIFRFIEPYYAPGVGRTAAQCVADALQSTGTVGDILTDLDSLGLSVEDMNALARQYGYSRFIAGRVNAYFEGSDFEAAVVAQEIWVYRTALPWPELLWHAAAREETAPKPLTDYIFVHSMGAPAYSTLVLLKRNAEKINNMLRDIPAPDAGRVASARMGTPVRPKPAYSGYR